MELFKYQEQGADFLAARKRAALWDEPGLGKTAQAIHAALRVGAKKVLVIAPTSLIWNWRREWEAWTGQHPEVISAGKQALDASWEGVTVTTHGLLLSSRVREALAKAAPFDAIILDEAHAFRNPSAKRTALFYGHAGVASLGERVWVLTGTPALNHSAELYTCLRALDPERFPENYTSFRARYCVLRPTHYGIKVVGNRNSDELRQRMDGLFLRRTKKDELDLPPIRFEMVSLRPLKLPTHILELDAQIGPAIRDMLTDYDDPKEAFEALGDVVDFAQWRRWCGMAKVEPLVDLIVEEYQNTPLLVFAHHTDVVGEINRQLNALDIRTAPITGAVPSSRRDRLVSAFQNGQLQVLVLNIQAGGVGLTMTRAKDVLFAELDWTPALNRQAADRVYRIGQEEPVRIRFVALDGTIDELVVSTVRRKTAMIKEIIR